MTLSPMRRRVVRTVLRVYPRWWRERYGTELLDLLERERLTSRVILDVLAAALRERAASSLAWQVTAVALLALLPFMVAYYFLYLAMNRQMMGAAGDPLLGLILHPEVLGQLWLTPLAVAVCSNIALRRVASRAATSWTMAALSALFCAVVSHGALLSSAFAEGRAGDFLLNAAWWRQVYPQLILLYAGFGAVGFVAHRCIVVLPRSARTVATR